MACRTVLFRMVFSVIQLLIIKENLKFSKKGRPPGGKMFLNDSVVEVGIQASTGVRFNYSYAGLNLRFISY